MPLAPFLFVIVTLVNIGWVFFLKFMLLIFFCFFVIIFKCDAVRIVWVLFLNGSRKRYAVNEIVNT